MKKYLLIVAISLFAITMQAQDIVAGVQAKLSGYKLSQPKREYITTLKPGFEFGAFARFGITDLFYFQPELGFSYIGGRIKPDGFRDASYQAAVFNIPLLFGLTAVTMNDANFRVYIGLGNTIPVLNNIKIVNGAIGDINEDLQSTAIQYHPRYELKSSGYEISGIVGIGFDMMDITIDLRYERGFNQVVRRKDMLTGKVDKFFQNTFSLSIGYKMIKP